MTETIAFETLNGHRVGRDPRRMTQDELRDAGHEPMSPSDALRLRCLDCCAGSANEVSLCVSVGCPSWPFRMGSSPWRAPRTEAQREAARANARRMHAAAGNHGSGGRSDAAEPQGVPQATPKGSGAEKAQAAG